MWFYLFIYLFYVEYNKKKDWDLIKTEKKKKCKGENVPSRGLEVLLR